MEGARFRVRCMISNWCFSTIDSAATARAPPGGANLTTVASRWATKTNNSFIESELISRSLADKAARPREIVALFGIRLFQGRW